MRREELSEQQQETNRLLKYFWEEKGDLERWVEWDTNPHIPPEVRKVWQDYKTAERILSLVINGLQD